MMIKHQLIEVRGNDGRLENNRCPSFYALYAMPGLRSGLASLLDRNCTRAPKESKRVMGRAAMLAMLIEARIAQTEFMAT